MKREDAFKKEWARLASDERKYLRRNAAKPDSKLSGFLESKVPDKLQSTLDSAFCKAFELIFDKGTGVIEKLYDHKNTERKGKLLRRAAEFNPSSRTLWEPSRGADAKRTKNLLVSGASGIGLGVLGIGIPDIPLFTALLFKGLQEIALSYGYEYESEKERYFMLMILKGAMSHEQELERTEELINAFIASGELPEDYSREETIKNAAGVLSTELLYMKFLQGIPVAGAIGGAYDAMYMDRATKYAKLKYRRRFLTDMQNKAAE